MRTLFVAFEDFIFSCEAALCSPETMDSYRGMLKPFLVLAKLGAVSRPITIGTYQSDKDQCVQLKITSDLDPVF